ncbi:histidinol-phosphate transaminase [Apibacter sp. HY039]|uniref:pyridoxal phosphate-dependent aminotransferase n=1 Tax=Apibacter sp. HY039 TaxID=2501476 RepID=UPI000FEB7BDC|nr:aminotransferase class I/II-fold pyridoxal phosphate-dependent enzyme [Apibacter sp. HY039]
MNRRDLLKLSGTAFAGLLFTGITRAGSTVLTEEFESLSNKNDSPLLLNFNENSLGISSMAETAIKKSLKNSFRYPDAEASNLRKQLADKFNVTPSHISLGSGSSDIIRAITHFCIFKSLQENKKLQIILPDPTFDLIADYAENLGVTISRIPLDSNFCMDITAMKKAAEEFNGVSLCYLCNPNNPTATLTSSDSIEKWIADANPENTFFLMDEAYAEYVTDLKFQSGIKHILNLRNNVLVTKTFSKVYAMAGYRIGYGIATPETSKKINTFLSIDNLNISGLVAASASLKDSAFLTRSLSSTNSSRKITETAMNELGIRFLPSQANFIFYHIPGDLKLYIQRLNSEGIKVGRIFTPLTQWNRVTLGTPEEMKIFVKTLYEFRKKGWI